MNRSRSVLASLRLAKSLLSARRLSSTRALSTQVTQFSRLSSLLCEPRSSRLVDTHQRLYFSSKPSSLVQLIVANDWSDELEVELQKSMSLLTHETVIYILKRLHKEPDKALSFFNWACEQSGFRPTSSVYSFMLRILAHKDTMKEFWVTLRKMKEQGFYLDQETYYTINSTFKKENMPSDVVALAHFYNRMLEENALDDVVKKMACVVSDAEWSNETEKELQDMGINLSDNLVIRVLRELRYYPKKALKFFHWVGLCSDYKHSTVTYNAVLRVLAQNASMSEFWTVFAEMKGVGFEMDTDTYIKISRGFQKSKMMEDSVKLFELMMDGPFKPSVKDCTILLKHISESNNPDLSLVFRVAKKYEAAGHSLSKPIYDGIHRSLTSVGRFDEAENIVKVMKNAGYEPDNITYSQLIFGLCKLRRLEEAFKVLDEMEAHGCMPDIKTWTILIQGLCKADAVDKALLCFAKMMEKNHEPDADLLDVLVQGFLSQKRIDGAYKLLLEMVDKAHLRPWQATFKILIEKLLESEKLEEAMKLLILMKKKSYPPYPEPFIPYISKFGTVDDALEFLKALSVKKSPASAYHRILESFLSEGRHSEAKDLLHKCPHHVRGHPKISELFGSAKSIKVSN